VIFAIGLGDQTRVLLTEVAAVDWRPDLLIPVSLAGNSALEPPSTFSGRVFLSFPVLPGNLTASTSEEYRELVQRRPDVGKNRAAVWPALGAARLLVEGLRRVGRDVRRERLIEELEGLRQFNSGFGPPLTFGTDRRVGAWGAYVVPLPSPGVAPPPIGGWHEVKSNRE
jgi:hypothetical protein